VTPVTVMVTVLLLLLAVTVLLLLRGDRGVRPQKVLALPKG
jgi:hypothetical protein